MARERHVAVMVDLTRLDAAQFDVLLGVRRFAQRHHTWRVHLDPHPTETPAAPYDGILAVAYSLSPARRLKRAIPFVTTSHTGLLTVDMSVWRVLPRLRPLGRLAAMHLHRCGFLRFGFLGFKQHSLSHFLGLGFRQKVSTLGLSSWTLSLGRGVLKTRARWPRLQKMLAEWLGELRPPVGVCVVSARLARYFADACLRHGRRVPEDVAIVSAGEDPAITEYPAPALTAIDLGYRRVGYEAAALLDELMDATGAEPRNVWVTVGRLVARRSTDVVTWRDPVAQRTCRWIAEHCGEPIRVGDVARALGMPLRELQRRISERHPRSLVQEIAHARLRRAKRLLRETAMPVGDVARAAGLSGASRLARLLRRADGVRPSDYRSGRGASRPEPPDEASELPDAPPRPARDTLQAAYDAEEMAGEVLRRPGRARSRGKDTPLPPWPYSGVDTHFIGPDGKEDKP